MLARFLSLCHTVALFGRRRRMERSQITTPENKKNGEKLITSNKISRYFNSLTSHFEMFYIGNRLAITLRTDLSRNSYRNSSKVQQTLFNF